MYVDQFFFVDHDDGILRVLWTLDWKEKNSRRKTLYMIYMGVSKNNGTPKSSILIGKFPSFSPSILGVFPLFSETPTLIFATTSDEVVPQNGWFIWKTLLKWMTWGDNIHICAQFPGYHPLRPQSSRGTLKTKAWHSAPWSPMAAGFCGRSGERLTTLNNQN